MGVTARIEHHAVVATNGFMQLVDQLALDIRLEVIHLALRECHAQTLDKFLESFGAVDVCIASSLQIEVRTVENQDFHFTKIYIFANIRKKLIQNSKSRIQN